VAKKEADSKDSNYLTQSKFNPLRRIKFTVDYVRAPGHRQARAPLAIKALNAKKV